MRKKIVISIIILLLVSAVYAATRNIVPRADGEGGLGTSSKNWLSAYIDTVFTNIVTFTDQDASPDAVGELQYDNTVANWDDGALCWYDDDEVKYLVDLATLPTNDDYVVAYDAAIDKFYMKADADSGGATAWNNIGNPTADDTIALAGYEVGFSSTLDEAAHVVLKIDHTDADVVAATTIFQIQSVDDAPANLTYIKVVDDTGATPNTVFSVGADGAVTSDGILTGLGVTVSTVLTNLIDAVGAVDIDYGSVDITDHTFVTDGTGTAEIVLPAGSIDGTEILDDTVDSADYAAASIDAEHLAADIVDETKIADNGIDSEHYNDGSIDLVHLAAAAYAKDIVTTAPITGATDNVLVGADSDVTIALTLLKDIVTTAPITGGADDVLPGADADLTLAITVLKDLVTTAPLTGGTDDILTGSDADITLAITVLKDLVTTAPVTGGTNDIFPGADADITIALDFTTAWAFDGNLSVGNATTTAGVLTLLEDDDDGSNFASFMVPALAANTVYTLPANDGDNLQVLHTDGSGVLSWGNDDSAGSTAWDDIGDPDNNGTTTIDFDNAGENTLLTTIYDAVGSFLTIRNSDADVANAMYLLDLDYSVDDNQANADYIICQDAGGAVFTVGQNGDVVSGGAVTASSFSGDGSSLTAIDAATGDSATAFFDAGTIEHEYGGLEADISGYTGLVAITGGATAEVDSKSELEGHIADVADFAEADGDIHTGVHDFGGATTLEIPNAESTDAALSALGMIHVRGDEDRISIHAGAGGEVAGEVTISVLSMASVSFDPGAWYDSDTEVFLFEVHADKFPNGIIIDEWKVSCNVDPDVEMDLDLKYADAWIGLANSAVIDVLDTTNGVSTEDTDANINGGTAVAAGKMVYLNFGADPEGTAVQMNFMMLFHAEED